MAFLYEHPLRWPVGWPRTPPAKRRRAPYKVSDAKARADLEQELRRMGVRDLVVSSNVPLRRDGTPYSGGDPVDPGVAVYWTALGNPRAMALDRWDSYAGNLRAAGLAFEALRAFDRTGAGHIVERVYQGFAALPSEGGLGKPKRPWRVVMGLAQLAGPAVACRAAVEATYKVLAAKLHPDAGGQPDDFVELTEARAEALREIDEFAQQEG